MRLWGIAIFRAVVTPELLQSMSFWAAICLQEEVWGLSAVGVVEKEARYIYLDCMFTWGSKGGGRLLCKGYKAFLSTALYHHHCKKGDNKKSRK